MKHRGEIVEQKVRESGTSIARIAREIGYTRSHIYVLFQKSDLELDIIIKIGKVIKYDFRTDFPDIFIDSLGMVEEPQHAYGNESLDECRTQRELLYKKYISLQEKHIILLQNQLKQYVSTLSDS